MSEPLGLKDARSLVWKVKKPFEETGAIESSAFICGGYEWCLKIVRCISSKMHSLYLVCKNGNPSREPLIITYYIDSTKPYHLRKKTLSWTSESKCVIDFLDDCQILEEDEYFHSRETMTFVVIFQEEVRLKTSVVKKEKANPHSGLESLSDDLGSLMLKEDSGQDVELKCGNKTLKAHANILSGRSSVFQRMLSTDMVERRSGKIEILDMEEDDFEAFVQHLHTGKLPELTQESAKSLYRAADKYEVAGLARLCAQFLIQNLTVENACDTLVLADVHGDQGFRDDVIDYVLDEKIPLMTDQWSSFMENYPKLAAEVLNKFYRSQIETMEK